MFLHIITTFFFFSQRWNDLPQVLRDAALKAEPVSQLALHIFSKFPSSSVSDEVKDLVTCLLIVERWIQEATLWNQFPGAYRVEMQRDLKTITLVLGNVIRQKCPIYYSKIESGILYALRSWSNSTQDCYLFTPPQTSEKSSNKMRTQFAALHAHSRLVKRVESIVAPIRPDALKGIKQLLSVLLRDHERKMMTASYTNSALQCLESVKSILSVSRQSGVCSEEKKKIAMNLITRAKYFSHSIPDKQWRDAMMKETEKFMSLLT